MPSSPKFSSKDIQLSTLAKALSHPARVAILRELANRKSCVCGEIVDILPLAQATVSQHLKELKDIGIIKGTVDGVKSCYCINWEAFQDMTSDFLIFFKEIISQKTNTDETC